MYLFIAGVDRSADVQWRDNDLVITGESQTRSRKMDFTLLNPPLPADYAEVRAFVGWTVLSATSTTVILDCSYDNMKMGMYRVGERFYSLLNTANEQYRNITAIDSVGGKIQITVDVAWTVNPVAGDKAGKIRFAGNVVDKNDENVSRLNNILNHISCIDYSRIFDKELINNSYANKDTRYIVNDFCNRTINLNDELDSMEYVNSAALQAVWSHTGDMGLPIIETTDYQEGAGSSRFPWVFSGGTATSVATLVARDDSGFSGIASGVATKGNLGFWYKVSDFTKVTSIAIRLGNDSTHYVSFSFTPTTNNYTFITFKLATGSYTGTVDWTTIDYMQMTVTETGSANVLIDGIRLLESKFFKHYPNVQTSTAMTNFNINRVKPTEIMKRLADNFDWYWYIDEEMYIYLFAQETLLAPFEITETSMNFKNLAITYDLSRLINKQVVEGSSQVSTSLYTEVRQGDSLTREWIMRVNYSGMVVLVDKNTSTLTTTVGTNTTTVVTTAPHGLAVGDYITNRTRSNAVRKVSTIVSPTSYTVDAVTSQTSGDTLSKFVVQTVGIDGTTTEASVNYMSNKDARSVRSSLPEATLTTGQFIQFAYYEIVPISAQKFDSSSIAAVKALLGYTDGIIEGQVIRDPTITSFADAAALAGATINQYSNTILTATFETDHDGLREGQLIHIKDTTNGTRNVDQQFIIQSIQAVRTDRWSYFHYQVTCSSLLFGIIELLMQMLKYGRNVSVDPNAVISNLIDANESQTMTDSWNTSIGSSPYFYGPASSNDAVFDLSSYS